jgi:RimJ/RimL family protein N-acetyltransferase
MENEVYIRPLRVEDALVSYKWRNNPRLWKYTGSRPDREITPEIETEWLKGALQRTHEKRFAICLKDNDQYIGNVFFTNVTEDHADINIFIGELQFWGGNRAASAAAQLIDYGFTELKLKRVYTDMQPSNTPAKTLAAKMNFVKVEEYFDDKLGMVQERHVIPRETFYEAKVKETVL